MDKATEQMMKKAAEALVQKYKEAEAGVSGFKGGLLGKLTQGLHDIFTPPEYQTKYEEKLKQASEYPDVVDLGKEERRRAVLFGGNPSEQIKASHQAKAQLSKQDPDYNFTSATGKHLTLPMDVPPITIPATTDEQIANNLFTGYELGTTSLEPTKTGYSSPQTVLNPYLNPDQKSYTKTHEMTHPMNIVYPKKVSANQTQDEEDLAKANMMARNEFAPRIGLPIKLFLAAVHGKAGTTEDELHKQINKLDENQINFLVNHIVDKYNSHKPAQGYKEAITTPQSIKARDESKKSRNEPNDLYQFYNPDAGDLEEQFYNDVKSFIQQLKAKDPTALKMLKSVSKVEKPDFNKTFA